MPRGPRVPADRYGVADAILMAQREVLSDGYNFLRHGAEPTEELLTLEQVAALDTGYPSRDLVCRVQAALDGRSYTAYV
jgi:hypothetical protein